MSRTLRSSRRHEAGTTARRYPSGVLTTSVLATSSGESPSASASASADSVWAWGRSSYCAPASSSARVRSSVAMPLPLRRLLLLPLRLDPSGASGRRNDALVPVLPAHAVPRRLFPQHLLDRAGVRRLPHALGFENDPVADASFHLCCLLGGSFPRA